MRMCFSSLDQGEQNIVCVYVKRAFLLFEGGRAFHKREGPAGQMYPIKYDGRVCMPRSLDAKVIGLSDFSFPSQGRVN